MVARASRAVRAFDVVGREPGLLRGALRDRERPIPKAFGRRSELPSRNACSTALGPSWASLSASGGLASRVSGRFLRPASRARPPDGCSVGARRPAVLVTARARGSPGSGHRTRVAATEVTRHWRQDSMPWQKAVRASGEHRGEGGLAIAVGDLGIDARRPTRRTESGI